VTVEHTLARIGTLLADALTMRPFRLMGCPRRNVWRGSWRSDVGAAVMPIVGTKQSVVWEGEAVDFYSFLGGQYLLLWRAGPWRKWWQDDARLLVGMVYACSSIEPMGVCILHEVDGQTLTTYVECPKDRSLESYQDALTAWRAGGANKPPRIAKDTDRAYRVCYRCPVRRRCDALDIELGETADWKHWAK